MKCRELVPHDSYSFRRCGKKAKWKVQGKAKCGLHAKLTNFYVKTYGRTALIEGSGLGSRALRLSSTTKVT